MRPTAAFFCAVLILAAAYNLSVDLQKTSPGQNDTPIDQYVTQALDFKKTEMTSISQLTILVLGAIWGLTFGSKRTMKARYPSIWVVFVISNAAFVSSYVLYLMGNKYLVETLFKAKSLDLDAPQLVLYGHNQILFFMVGLVVSLVFAGLYYWSSEEKP